MPEQPDATRSPQSLVDLYCKTHYDIRMPGGQRCSVRIGQAFPAPLGEFPCHAWNAFLVSACNPHSVSTRTGENRRRMQELLLCVQSAGHRCLPGVGHIPGQAWREAFLLVINIDRTTIDDIARRFGQNATVSLQANLPARLRIHCSEWRSRVRESPDIEWAA